MSYISKEKLLSLLWSNTNPYVEQEKVRPCAVLNEVCSVVRTFEEEDVAPIVHAHWEQNESGKIRCSYCKHKMHLVPESNYACEPFYCAFCGAKMDMESD